MSQSQMGNARRINLPRALRKVAVPVCLALLLPATSSSSAAASVTIGQVDPVPEGTCGSNNDFAQLAVGSGNGYVVPETGTVTSWSHNARDGGSQEMTLKVFRKLADPANYVVVGHDGPRPLAPSTLNTFPTSIGVRPGDILGLNTGSGNFTDCIFYPPGTGDTHLLRSNSNLGDAEFGDFGAFAGGRLNVSAIFVPTNTFTLGATTRNKKKGTATVEVTIPNPGELTTSGKGVKAAAGSQAVISKTVTAPGAVNLVIKAKGRKRKTLNLTGKVLLKPTITYTPAGGDPTTQSLKVKLKKR